MCSICPFLPLRLLSNYQGNVTEQEVGKSRSTPYTAPTIQDLHRTDSVNQSSLQTTNDRQMKEHNKEVMTLKYVLPSFLM